MNPEPLENSFDTGRIPTSFRRKISAVLLGICYGGSIVNGIEQGINFVLKSETGLSEFPVLGALVGIVASGLGAFLAAYSAQSSWPWVLSLASLLPLVLFSSGTKDLGVLATIAGAAIGIGLGIYATRLPLPAADVENGRLFGIRWGHWLWLWLPWQAVVSNVVWFVLPPLLGEAKPSGWDLFNHFLRAPVMLILLGYSVVQALNSIRDEAPWSRGQAVLRFLGWLILFPIAVNLMRIFGFL